eukprot:104326_1
MAHYNSYHNTDTNSDRNTYCTSNPVTILTHFPSSELTVIPTNSWTQLPTKYPIFMIDSIETTQEIMSDQISVVTNKSTIDKLLMLESTYTTSTIILLFCGILCLLSYVRKQSNENNVEASIDIMPAMNSNDRRVSSINIAITAPVKYVKGPPNKLVREKTLSMEMFDEIAADIVDEACATNPETEEVSDANSEKCMENNEVEPETHANIFGQETNMGQSTLDEILAEVLRQKTPFTFEYTRNDKEDINGLNNVGYVPTEPATSVHIDI